MSSSQKPDTFGKAQSRLEDFESVPMPERIAERLREAILAGELRPGDSIVEATLAEQLGVSRAPVREALRLLAQDGLVESMPYRGTRVKSLSQQDVEELSSFRAILEEFAVRRVIAKRDPRTIAALRNVCESMQDSARKHDWKSVSSEDQRFHRTLIEGADHRLLLSSWVTLSLRVRQVMALRNLENRDPMQVALNHPPLVDAIEKGATEKAIKLLRAHVATMTELWDQAADG